MVTRPCGSAPLHRRATDRRRSWRCNERGASEAFILIVAAALMGFVGVVFDAGMAFNAKREAANIAANAARAGANEVDLEQLYDQSIAVIDPNVAIGRAEWVAQTSGGESPDATYDSSTGRLTVTVEMTHSTIFLGLFGIDEMTMSAESDIRLQQGLPDALPDGQIR